jgi:hypothetical protein
LALRTSGRAAKVTPAPARCARLPDDGARARIERGAVVRDASEDEPDETDAGRRRGTASGADAARFAGGPPQSSVGGGFGVGGPPEVEAEESESERDEPDAMGCESVSE